MNHISTDQERAMKHGFLNIILALVAIGVWATIAAGDILPGSLPNIIMFDAVIIMGICGVSTLIKMRSFNLACLFFQIGIGLIAAQIYIANASAPVLYLIPALLTIAVILLPLPLFALTCIFHALLIVTVAPGAQIPPVLTLIVAHIVIVGTLKRYFVAELSISQRFQDYAADQMLEARESRAKLVQTTKQLQEYQERLRVTNQKLEIAFEQAEESRQLKARFAANVSHELRTPINLIVGFSEVMILAPEVYDQPLPAAYRADIHAVYRNAKYLQDLINDVLDISQLEARHLAIVKEKCNLRDCVRETANMVKDLIAKKGLDFRLDIPEDLPELWFDPVRIRQILLNLLVNAVRFTSQGSITIEITVGESQVVTSVVDTGIGLSADDIDHIFEEFYQVDTVNRMLDKGSGLGLTLSRELIRLHGGEMKASSPGIPGQGSRFSFALPTTSNLVAQMPTSNHLSSTSTVQRRVLVAHEDEAVTAFLLRYLRSHKVVACNSEAEALQTLSRFEPDVLLLARDHSYQRLLDRARKLDFAPNVITLPMPSGRAAIMERGVAEYLVKPVSRETISRALARFEHARAIMIIDDNRDIVRLYSQTLRSINAGFRIRTAFDGATGLAIMQDDPPDLLILDVLMPGMDGFAVLETMRGDERLRQAPIILISAKGASESITPNIYGDITLERKSGYSPLELVTSIQALIDGIRQPVEQNASRAQNAPAYS